MTEGVTEPSAATWFGFVLMCLGMFMAILDIQVVATSLPTIQSTLAISREAMSWIQTAYLIAEIIAIPLTGCLTRALTLLWLFVIAVSLFTLASIGCAFSGSFGMLVTFRVLQGFAGGALIPAVFSAVFLLFPIRLHPVATTMAGIMAVLAPTVGPVVGGWITDTCSWHWLFLINVAPGAIAALATPMLLPRERPRFSDLATLDVPSLALLAVSPCMPGDRPEGRRATRVALAILLYPDCLECCRGNCLHHPNPQGRASGGRSVHIWISLVCDRLRIELPPRNWIVRLGLSHAGLSGLCSTP
ncbi:MFS family permease [Bradyrhizobium sp. F1.13.1]